MRCRWGLAVLVLVVGSAVVGAPAANAQTASNVREIRLTGGVPAPVVMKSKDAKTLIGAIFSQVLGGQVRSGAEPPAETRGAAVEIEAVLATDPPSTIKATWVPATDGSAGWLSAPPQTMSTSVGSAWSFAGVQWAPALPTIRDALRAYVDPSSAPARAGDGAPSSGGASDVADAITADGDSSGVPRWLMLAAVLAFLVVLVPIVLAYVPDRRARPAA